MKIAVRSKETNTGFVTRIFWAAKKILEASTLERSPAEDTFRRIVVPPKLRHQQSEIEKEIAEHKRGLRSIEIRFSHEEIAAVNKKTVKVFSYQAKLNHKERELFSQLDFLSEKVADDHYLSEYLAYHDSKPMPKEDDTIVRFVPRPVKKGLLTFINKFLGVPDAPKTQKVPKEMSFKEREFDKARVDESVKRMQAIMQQRSRILLQIETLRAEQAPKREAVEQYYANLKNKCGNAFSEWFILKEKIFNLEEELRDLTGL